MLTGRSMPTRALLLLAVVCGGGILSGHGSSSDGTSFQSLGIRTAGLRPSNSVVCFGLRTVKRDFPGFGGTVLPVLTGGGRVVGDFLRIVA